MSVVDTITSIHIRGHSPSLYFWELRAKCSFSPWWLFHMLCRKLLKEEYNPKSEKKMLQWRTPRVPEWCIYWQRKQPLLNRRLSLDKRLSGIERMRNR